MSEIATQALALQPTPQSRRRTQVRALYWSIRRECWEHPSLWRFPVAATVAALAAYAYVLTFRAEALTREWPLLMWVAVSTLVYFAVLLPTINYAAEALYGERRDKSVLFWKSLPVSDCDTVLSKLTVLALVLIPLKLVLLLAAHLAMVGMSELAAAQSGLMNLSLLSKPGVAVWPSGAWFVVVVSALWLAPWYAWLLFVSGWVRHSPLLWAAVPIVGLMGIERLVFDDRPLWRMASHAALQSRHDRINVSVNPDRLGAVYAQLAELATTPHLWIGLAVAAVLVFATIRMRSHRGLL